MNQDLKPVILSNPNSVLKNQSKQIVKRDEIRKPNVIPGVKLNEHDEVTTIKYVPKDISNMIITGRCLKKLTRKQLANNLNLKEDIIADIETGKAIYNGTQIAKIKKYLGIK